MHQKAPTAIANVESREGRCLLARESNALLIESGSIGAVVGADVVGPTVSGAGYTRNMIDCPISQ